MPTFRLLTTITPRSGPLSLRSTRINPVSHETCRSVKPSTKPFLGQERGPCGSGNGLPRKSRPGSSARSSRCSSECAPPQLPPRHRLIGAQAWCLRPLPLGSSCFPPCTSADLRRAQGMAWGACRRGVRADPAPGGDHHGIQAADVVPGLHRGPCRRLPAAHHLDHRAQAGPVLPGCSGTPGKMGRCANPGCPRGNLRARPSPPGAAAATALPTFYPSVVFVQGGGVVMGHSPEAELLRSLEQVPHVFIQFLVLLPQLPERQRQPANIRSRPEMSHALHPALGSNPF